MDNPSLTLNGKEASVSSGHADLLKEVLPMIVEQSSVSNGCWTSVVRCRPI